MLLGRLFHLDVTMCSLSVQVRKGHQWSGSVHPELSLSVKQRSWQLVNVSSIWRHPNHEAESDIAPTRTWTKTSRDHGIGVPLGRPLDWLFRR